MIKTSSQLTALSNGWKGEGYMSVEMEIPRYSSSTLGYLRETFSNNKFWICYRDFFLAIQLPGSKFSALFLEIPVCVWVLKTEHFPLSLLALQSPALQVGSWLTSCFYLAFPMLYHTEQILHDYNKDKTKNFQIHKPKNLYDMNQQCPLDS